MAPINKVLFGFALQSGKGQIADAPQYRIKATGTPSLGPTVNRSKLEETSGSRDGGERETNLIEVGGDFACYLRSLTAPLLFYGALGAKAVSGTTPNFSHFLSAADDQPWFTIWKFWGGQFAERYHDCKFTMQGQAQAGQSVQATISAMGLDFDDVTGDIAFDPYTLASNTGAGVLDNSPTIRVPGVVYNFDNDENADISEFSFNINAAQNTMQTTRITNSIMEPGLRDIEVNFTEVAKLGTYKKLVYGGSGTNPSQEITHESIEATFKDAKNIDRLTLNIPNFAYLTGELPINPNGEIGTMAVTGAADPPASGTIYTAEVKNSVASYAPAA